MNNSTKTRDDRLRARLEALQLARLSPDDPVCHAVILLWRAAEPGTEGRRKAFQWLEQRREFFEQLLESLEEDLDEGLKPQYSSEVKETVARADWQLYMVKQALDQQDYVERRGWRSEIAWRRLGERGRALMLDLGLGPNDLGMALDALVECFGGIEVIVEMWARFSQHQIAMLKDASTQSA